jgi:hypothetical protein
MHPKVSLRCADRSATDWDGRACGSAQRPFLASAIGREIVSDMLGDIHPSSEMIARSGQERASISPTAIALNSGNEIAQ